VGIIFDQRARAPRKPDPARPGSVLRHFSLGRSSLRFLLYDAFDLRDPDRVVAINSFPEPRALSLGLKLDTVLPERSS